MSQRYLLELSEEQVRVLSAATELYARIGMGQLSDVALHVPKHRPLLTDKLRELEPLATGLGRGCSLGIEHKEVWDSHRIAWDLYQVARNRLAWDAHPEGGIQVCFDRPRRVGPESIARFVTASELAPLPEPDYAQRSWSI